MEGQAVILLETSAAVRLSGSGAEKLFCHCCRAVCCTRHLGAVHPIFQDSLSTECTMLSAASDLLIRQWRKPRNVVADYSERPMNSASMNMRLLLLTCKDSLQVTLAVFTMLSSATGNFKLSPHSRD